MYNISESQQKSLDIATEYFRKANLHPSTIRFRKDLQENMSFYDGADNSQWTPEAINTLRERGQEPITVNICKGFIDNISGVEIQSRHRVACRSDSGKIEDDKLALALTHGLYHIQTNQDQSRKGSVKFRDMLICGIGWSNQYECDGKFYYVYENPINIIPDPDCLDPQYEGMKFVCKKWWMTPEKVRALYPKTSKYIDFNDSYIVEGIESPEIMDRQSSYTNSNTYTGINQSRVLVVEVQHKINKKAYCSIDKNGNYFETFDEEKAEKLSNSSKDIEEKDSERIIRTLFLDDILLETAPLNPDLPDLKSFSYIPCVWKRRFSTGVPYGISEAIKDLQRDLNIRITKSIYLINSSRIVVSGNLQPGGNTERLRNELKRNDSVIILPEGTNFQIESNAQLGKEQLDVAKEYFSFMQRVTGVSDEQLGIQTNATSAIAQNVRQVNSVRTNIFGFDIFSSTKEKEARFFLDLIQVSGLENMLVQIMQDDKKESIILNLTREINGEKVVFNDIRTLPLSLYLEEVPDYKSSFEEQREMLQSLLSNQNANWIMHSPRLLEIMGIRDGEKIAGEIKRAMQEKMMMEQGPQMQQANSNVPQSIDNLGAIEEAGQLNSIGSRSNLIQ